MPNRRTRYREDLKLKARALRKEMTGAEKKLWYGCLRSFPLPVLRQKPVDNHIVDFYCSKLQLAIEVDGDSHFDDSGIARDRARTQALPNAESASFVLRTQK
jgi:very-short-patch-repair endonuclease